MTTGPHGIWYLVVLLPLLVLLGWWYYRHTVPEVSSGRRVLLLTLRVAALAGLALALARPVFTWESEANRKPVWLRLADYSTSMERTDGAAVGETRFGTAERIMSDPIWQDYTDRVSVTTDYFADGYDSDSSKVGRAGTDLYGALDALARETHPPATVFVISDGAVNAAKTLEQLDLPFPVYSVCVGDSGRAEDRALVSIDAPSVTTAGDSVHVAVRAKASGDPQTAILSFSDGEHESHRTIQLDGGGREHEVTFSFVPDTAGVYKVTADLSAAPDEIAAGNNHIETRVYVEPRNRKVLILSYAPNWESAFLLRELQENDRLEVTIAYQALSGRHGFVVWPQSYDSLAQYDMIALTDMAPGRWQRLSGMLKRHLDEDAAGLLVMLGPQAAAGEWSEAQKDLIQLRFSAEPPGVYSVTGPVLMSSEGRMHPVADLDTTAEAAAVIWTGLPLLTGVIPAAVAPGAVSLVENIFGVQSWPVLVAGKVGKGRVLTTAGYPIWRWDFASAVGDDQPGWSAPFWLVAARWLTLAQEGELLSITPAADPVPALTPPAFTALLVDETWRPVRGAVVTAEIMDSAGTVVQTFDLAPGQPGRYAGSGRPLEPGDYTYRVQARVDESVMATSEGQLTATSVSREDVYPGSRPDLLDRLASETGGKRLGVDNWQSALSDLPTAREAHVAYGSFRLWESPWFLVVLILLFSAEWILRRRFQML